MGKPGYGELGAMRKRLKCVMPRCGGFWLDVFLLRPDRTGRGYFWMPARRYLAASVTHDNPGQQPYFLCICSKGEKCPMPIFHVTSPPQELLDMVDAVDNYVAQPGYDSYYKHWLAEPVMHLDFAADAYDWWFDVVGRVREKLEKLEGG